MTSQQTTAPDLRWRVSRHLDDDSLDHPGQPRDQLFAEDRATGSTRSPTRPKAIGRRSATSSILAENLAVEVLRQARVTAFKQIARRRRRNLGRHDLRASAQGLQWRLQFRRAAARRRSRHRRHRHRLRAHRARPRPRGLRGLDRERSATRTRVASTPSSPTPSTRTAPSPSRRRASPASACSTTRARRATPTRP